MIELQMLNLAVQLHLHKADVGSSALQLSSIQVNQNYLNEWNNNSNDFVCLTKNGELLRPTLISFLKSLISQDFFQDKE